MSAGSWFKGGTASVKIRTSIVRLEKYPNFQKELFMLDVGMLTTVFTCVKQMAFVGIISVIVGVNKSF